MKNYEYDYIDYIKQIRKYNQNIRWYMINHEKLDKNLLVTHCAPNNSRHKMTIFAAEEAANNSNPAIEEVANIDFTIFPSTQPQTKGTTHLSYFTVGQEKLAYGNDAAPQPYQKKGLGRLLWNHMTEVMALNNIDNVKFSPNPTLNLDRETIIDVYTKHFNAKPLPADPEKYFVEYSQEQMTDILKTAQNSINFLDLNKPVQFDERIHTTDPTE